MDCAAVEELLPWLLNGSLEAAEAKAVKAHLAWCSACQEAAAETAWVGELSAQHVPSRWLVDLAAGAPLSAGERELLETHLETCAACREELALVRTSWSALGEAAEADRAAPTAPPWLGRVRPPAFSAPRRRGALALAAAATIAAVGLGAWGFRQWNEAVESRSLVSGERVRHAAEVERLEEAAAGAQRARQEAEARLAELRAPRLNPRVMELMPTELVLRGASSELPVITAPPGGRVTLLLYAAPNRPTSRDYGVELRDAQGKVVWSRRGLVQQPGGDFSLDLPVDLLPDGEAELRVLPPAGGDAPFARYRFLVRLGRPSGARP